MAKRKTQGKLTKEDVKVTFDVEFQGEIFNNRTISSTSVEWQHLSLFPNPIVMRPVPIPIPAYQFDAAQVLMDEVRASWDAKTLTLEWHDKPAVGPASVVILLESPHNDEYDPQTRLPIAPLNNPAVRQSFQCMMPKILRKLQDLGINIPSGDIVLCNPVPYQASLARLYAVRRALPWATMRTVVWRELFSISILRQYFEVRVASVYKPSVVVNACTIKLKRPVRTAITTLIQAGDLDARLVEVYHPSSWNCENETPTLDSVNVII